MIFRMVNNIPKKCLMGQVDFIALPLSEPVWCLYLLDMIVLASEAADSPLIKLHGSKKTIYNRIKRCL